MGGTGLTEPLRTRVDGAAAGRYDRAGNGLPPQPPQRVLVVEDETPIRDGLLSLLRGQGLVVSGVGDGRQALEVLRDERFDGGAPGLVRPLV